MGCRCANESEEEKKEEEILKHDIENGNRENNEIGIHKIDDDLLGLNEDQNQNKNENNNINEEIDKAELNKKYADYPEKITELINNIREDPVGYADIVESAIENIIVEEDKEDPSLQRLIYKKKVKVALTRGKPAFLEAAEHLKNTEPLPPLEFVPEICIPLPEDESEMKDTNFLKKKVIELKKEGINIDIFYKDLVKIPEVSALLMIVDDSGRNAGKKRMTLLDKDVKYIGVNSKFIGKTFIAYLSFVKSDTNEALS